MIESTHLIAAVKQALRGRRITYRKLAKLLKMSESGVKKLFACGDCSIARLLTICDAIGISLEDVAREAESGQRQPATLSPAQQAFFFENPQCFYYLWELIANGFDARAVATGYGLDDKTQRRYLVALEAQGCIRVLGAGVVRAANGFRFGIQLPHRLAKVMFHAQQLALLESARMQYKSGDDTDPASLTSLGMGRLRLRRETVIELKRSLRAQGIELEQRSRRDVLTAPEDCIEMGLMTVLAPFRLADVVSLKELRIKPAPRPRG